MADTQTEHRPDTAPQEFEYKAEMKQLLHLIVHSLYTHSEIFLRELISNASDALNKARFRKLTDPDLLSAQAPLHIKITLDEDARTLVIEDTGIGMTRDDLIRRIGTVASSGTLAFLEDIKQAGRPIDAQLIGQFGVGFYSAFMVAERIVIETRHADPDSQGLRWESDGTGHFTIAPADRIERGTTITLHLKEDAAEFSRDYRVRQIIQKYSNFVDFPIYLGDEQVNTVKALWRKQKSDIADEELAEFYKFVSGDYTDPLGHLHLSLEGVVSFRALLFVPAVAPPTLFRDDDAIKLHLYANNVFIQDDCKELLPEYLRFIRGVVDAEDLPLNVSREVTQKSPVLAKIRSILTGKVLDKLKEWADEEPETYATFFRNFGPLFKMGINSDYKNRDAVIDLLRFQSTKTEKGTYTSLRAYVDGMADEQEAVYYLAGEHRDVLERNPNLEYFKRNDIEVLLLIDPIDVFTVPNIDTYDGKPLKSIEKADLDLKQDEALKKDALPEEDAGTLTGRIKQTLGDRVEAVIASKRLVDSAATLVVGASGMDPHMERMMKMMNRDVPAAAKILEINTAHPLIKNLSALLEAGGHDDLLDRAILQLFEGALLIDGNLTEPTAFVARMTELMTRATKP